MREPVKETAKEKYLEIKQLKEYIDLCKNVEYWKQINKENWELKCKVLELESNSRVAELEAEIFMLKLDIQKDEKTMFGYDGKIKGLEEDLAKANENIKKLFEQLDGLQIKTIKASKLCGIQNDDVVFSKTMLNDLKELYLNENGKRN